MTKTLIKDTLRTVSANKLRFVSIIIIVALGMSFFVGINSASPAMKYEANEYFNRNNLMDIYVTSPIPFTSEDIEKIKNIENVAEVAGSQYVDGYATVGQDFIVNKNGTELTCRVNRLDADMAQAFFDGEDNQSYFNRIDLKDGRLPEKADECVVDEKAAELYADIEIGKALNISAGEDGMELELNNTRFTVVGVVSSPQYISEDRGQTKLGSGKLDTYIYVLPEVFLSDEINEIFVKMTYWGNRDSFSDEYVSRAKNLSEQIKQVSAAAFDEKLAQLKNEYTEKIKNKTDELSEYKLSSSKQIEEKEKYIKEFKNYVDNEDSILTSLKETNDSEVKRAGETLKSLEKQLEALTASYNTHSTAMENQSSEIKGYTELKKLYDELSVKHTSEKEELDALESSYLSAKNAYDAKVVEVQQSENNVNSSKTSLESLLNGDISSYEVVVGRYESSIQKKQQEINSQKNILTSMSETDAGYSTQKMILNQLNSDLSDLESGLSGLKSAKSKFDADSAALSVAVSEKNALETTCNNAKSSYETSKKSYDADSVTLEKHQNSMKELVKNQSGLAKLIEQVDEEKKQLEELKISVTRSRIEYTLLSRNGSIEISKAEYDLKSAKSRYNTVDDEYAELKNEIQVKTDTLNSELKNLETTLANLANLRWTATPRNELPGMDSFETSLENMKSMSEIFPIVFLVTAMIACLVILVKNVEEERKKIGLFKAFGYSNFAIIGKYMVYSLLSWAIGAFVGTVVGTCVLPFVICSIYNATYSVPNAGTVFLSEYVFFGLAVSFIIAFFSTLFAVIRELKFAPATLMRPKNILYNRRNILEKIPSLWNKMSYGMVVVARTMSRSRERVTIGMVGIACCTALILSSLGLINSTLSVSGAQYDENGIFKYDVMFVLKTPQSEDTKILESIKNDQRTENAELCCNKSAVAYSTVRENVKQRTVSIISMKNTEDLSDYVNFEMVEGNLDWGLGSVVITDKMAEDLGLTINDSIYLTLADGEPCEAIVSGIVKNYTNHYVYMSAQTYERVFDAAPQYKYIVASAKSYVDEQGINDYAATFLKEDVITGASTASDMSDSEGISVNRILAVVMLFVLAACLLAIIVMYTNSNVNLSERTREIANIKVIGLSDREVLIYVIRENLISTVYGLAVGLIGGYFLHKTLFDFISVENVVYGDSISWWSYLVTVAIIAVITLISAWPIKIKVGRINMAETLKEIE